MAEYYSVELAQKVRRGQKESRLKGNYCGGGIPYGYTISKVDNNKKYVIKEEEAAVVNRIFNEYAAGKICREIIGSLTADGIYGRDGKPFGKNAIYGILQNERYTGVYRHKTDGVFRNMFPRIVPQALFDNVQRICEKNRLGKQSRDNPYLLRGKIICGYCGANIRGDAGTSHTGQVMKYYACANRKKITDKCRKQAIRKDAIEKLVLELTVKVLDKPKTLEPLIDKIFELNESRSQTNSALLILQKELSTCQRFIDNIMRAMEEGIITATTKDRLRELEEQKENLKARLLVEDSKARIKITKQDVQKFISKALREESAKMLKLLIKKIVLYDDKIEIYYNTTERKRPDEEDTHQAFSFYTEKITSDSMNSWLTATEKGMNELEVNLLI